MRDSFAEAKVIPVLIFDNVADAVPTASALIEGGLSILEVTLRTDEAWLALEAIVAAHPRAMVGVGTVLDPEQMARGKASGASFAVSPGFDPLLAAVAREQELFYLPGVSTASEVMAARRGGIHFQKFFPAEAAGGTTMLKSFASPFRDITFCPTGGVGPGNVGSYLALDNVVCVGGSWVATATDMAGRDWGGISSKAREAASAGS